MANVSVSNTPGLYIGSGASAVLNSAQQLLSLLSNQGNVNFALATGNSTVQGFFVGTNGSTYSNANVAAYLPVNSANVAGAYFIGDGSQLTNLPIAPNSYGNANVAAFLPTYTGSLALSSTIVTLNANVGTLFLGNASTNANLGAFQTFSNANAASQATAINTINANLGAFQTYANNTFGTSSYGNANVAAFLPTYTGTLDNSSTIVNLVANAATQATAINTINANLGAFQTYANNTFGTSTYSNVNVAAYLSTSASIITNSNAGIVRLQTTSNNASFSLNYPFPGDVGIDSLAGNIVLDGSLTYPIRINNTSGNIDLFGNWINITESFVNPVPTATLKINGNIQATESIVTLANVNASSLVATNSVNATTGAFTGQLAAANIATTNGLFWSNGVNYSATVPGLYSNANVAAYQVTSTTILTNSNNSVIRIQNTANTAALSIGNFGLDTATLQSANATIAGTGTFPLNIDNSGANVEYSGSWHNFRQTTGSVANNTSLKVFGNVQANQMFSNTGYFWANGTAYSTGGGGGGSDFTSNLTINGNYILNGNINLIREQFANIGTINGTTTINANVGMIQAAVVASNITINTNNLTNFIPGQTITLKLRQATNTNLRILTSNILYAGGSKTLSTANAAIDTITITWDGEQYLGALVKGYS